MREYKLTIKKKRVKNISIRVVSFDEVVLTVPYLVSKKRALEFLDSKSVWIDEKLKSFSRPLELKDGEKIYYIGKYYQIKLYDKKSVMIDGDLFFIPKLESHKKLDRFLKARAKELFGKLIQEWEVKLNKKIQRLSVKRMKTRWGSCNTQKAYINLNLNLIHKPIKVIEYVILHEMAHLTHPNHSKEFHSYVENFMPDWKEREKLLKFNF